ncbi:hypothetical protein AN958_05851 [Leucoagaricus sp. SymC.cos]|nr:hypothetical protein AN958_05851 [Leucoagaricus sp. SymC.cos]
MHKQHRTNKLLQGLSQFKGIIRISGRKTRDDRDVERFPYPSQMNPIRSNTITKPFMSQPHLGLERGLKGGHHDSEMSKLSESPLSSPHSDKPVQSFEGGDAAGISESGRVIDGLPPVMNPKKPFASPPGDAKPFPKTQPLDKRPRGQKRPSTANSTVTTTSSATTVKAPGPLLKLKRSFSQLRLNSFSKQQPDVTGSSSAQQQPPPLPSPESANTSAQPTSPSASSSTPARVPKKSSSTPPPSVPPSATQNPSSITTPTTPSQTHPYPNMTASGPLAPMSLPRPVPPPHSGTRHRRVPAQPPKLSLPPVNHRLSLTISPALATDTGPARFSPTVISRPMPLPLSNLPILTPRSDSLKAASSVGASVGRQHLKTMPSLPIQGTGRGVKGHEEADDMEDDESADDDDELDEDEGETSSRLDSSRSGFVAPDTSADSMRLSFDSSVSSVASSSGLDHLPPASGLGASQARGRQRERTPSTGSSYHSALDVLSCSHPPQHPEFVGLGVGIVPILKQPTPPRAFTQQSQASSASASSSNTQPGSSSQTQSRSSAFQGSSLYNIALPEVDTSRIDFSFIPLPQPASSTSPVIDVKGKGKARDIGTTPTTSAMSPTNGTRGIGVDYSYDPSKTPTAATVAAATTSGMYNTGSGGYGNMSGTSAGSFAFRTLNGTPSHFRSSSQNQSQDITGAMQSPTGTIRQALLHHTGGGVGTGNNSSGDYFSAKGLGSGFGGATSSPRPAPVAYHHHHSRPPASSNNTSYTSHSRSQNLQHSVALSPSPSSPVQTPRLGVGGLGDMKSPASLFSGMPPRRSSTLMVQPQKTDSPARDVRGMAGGRHQAHNLAPHHKLNLEVLHSKNIALPEVDTSRIDFSFIPLPQPASSTSPVIDVKGKGKARDIGTTPTTSAMSPTNGTRGIGVDYSYDPSKTPTAATVAAATTSGMYNTGSGGYGNMSGTSAGSFAFRTLNGTPSHFRSSSQNQSQDITGAMQSPTGTIRQALLHHTGGGVGTGNNSSGDYFSAKGFGSGFGGATSSPRPAPVVYHHHHSRPPASSNNASYTSYSRSQNLQHSVALSPSPSSPVQTPRLGVGGLGDMKSPASLFSGMPPRRSSTLMVQPQKTDSPARDVRDDKIKEDDGHVNLRRGDSEAPPAFSSISTPAATAMTKKQNRLSTASHYLRRRRSMPMYDESSEPPPYPTFAPHPPSKYKVMPREDEGRERLPPYTNPIYLKAIMPRKMEFSSPGVQAKDRKWRRVMCVLDGTALRVYKCPPGHAGVGVIGEWWEKQVGAGDVSSQPSHAGAVSNIQIETRETRRLAEERRDLERQIQRIIKSEDGAPDRPRTASSVSMGQTPTMSSSSSSRSRFAQFLKPGTRHTRSKSDVHMSERNNPSPSPRQSLNIPMSGSGSMTPSGSVGSTRSPSPFPGSGNLRAQTPMSSVTAVDSISTGRGTPLSSLTFSSSRMQQQQQQQALATEQKFLYTNRERDFLPHPDSTDLVRVYTLQHAESGIGNDYSKRKNVIRLRLEGEQFLLQARDVTGVVEWIEALQAATSIALDLDERPMPRGPLFPRRRRRRRPQTETTGPGATEGGQTTSSTVTNAPVATM